MSHLIPELSYAHDALEPYFDARTMEIHHTKHHQAYVTILNAAIKDHARLDTLSVEQLIRNLKKIPANIRTAVRNHGSGQANHRFFWPLLKKGVRPSSPALDAIKLSFGSLEKFKEDFSAATGKVFGSGWTWLVMDNGITGR